MRPITDLRLIHGGLEGPHNCERCGTPMDYPSRKCDNCLDAEEHEARQTEIEAKWAVTCPPRLAAVRFDLLKVDPHNETAIRAARNFAEKPDGFLFLTGPAGTGKTVLALATARGLIEAGRDVLFLRAVDLFSRLKDGYDRRFKDLSPSVVMDTIKAADVLVLDDLGAEKISDWHSEIILDVVDHRYSYLRGTIVTSNLTGAEVARNFGARTASRIKGGGVMLTLGGLDRRVSGGSKPAIKINQTRGRKVVTAHGGGPDRAGAQPGTRTVARKREDS